MGRKKMAERRDMFVNVVDFEEYEAATHICSPKSLDCYVEEGLFAKRGPAREEALFEIIKAFTHSTKHEIAEKKFATIMLRCLNLVKKGSVKEICLATKAIGLLAIILGHGDSAYELFEESLSTYSQMLSFQDESVNVLECLAIVTLVGAEGFSDIERSMKVIWKNITILGSNTSSNEASTPVLAAAISAWSFLLTIIDERQLDHSYWQGTISYFLNLLGEGEYVRATSVEALIVIFEKRCIEKFSTEAYKAFMHSFEQKEDTTLCLEELKYKIVEHVKDVCNLKWEVLEFFEEEHKFDMSMHICGNSLTFSTLSQLKKSKYIEQFLGDGYEVHMMENEFLQQAFDFKLKEAPPCPEIYVPETEEVSVRYFSPDIRKDNCKQKFERSPNSLLSKARTQLMKKHRMLAQERKTGGFLTC